jgi:hypothetical protein
MQINKDDILKMGLLQLSKYGHWYLIGLSFDVTAEFNLFFCKKMQFRLFQRLMKKHDASYLFNLKMKKIKCNFLSAYTILQFCLESKADFYDNENDYTL